MCPFVTAIRLVQRKSKSTSIELERIVDLMRKELVKIDLFFAQVRLNIHR